MFPSVFNGVLWGTSILLPSSTPTTWVPAPSHASQPELLISTPLGILLTPLETHAQGAALDHHRRRPAVIVRVLSVSPLSTSLYRCVHSPESGEWKS